VTGTSAPETPARVGTVGRATAPARPPVLSRRATTPGLLALVLGGALALRLWSIDAGLPLVLNYDEDLHFVPPAVEMLRGSLNPGYFQNPPGLTYLLHAVLRGAGALGVGSLAPLPERFASDPGGAFLAARLTVAAVGTGVVALSYWTAARLWDRRVGLVAAAIMGAAFLPVLYSKQALNDVVTLAPVLVAMVGCVGVLERGGTRDFAVAGTAIGLAVATKYTAGALLLGLVIAAVLAVRGGVLPLRRAAIATGAAMALAGLVALALNPYALLDFATFRTQMAEQALVARFGKLGQERVPGWVYYAWTLTWGLGWAPLGAALVGTCALVRQDARRAAVIAAFPLFLFLFIGAHQQYYARWLMPAYAGLVLLGAYGAVRIADALPARRGLRSVALAGLSVLLVAQGLVSSVHVGRVLGRPDTRETAREWLLGNLPSGTGLAAEPLLPQGYLSTVGRDGPAHYRLYPVRRPFSEYQLRLSPGRIDAYRAGGWCWVLVTSFQRDRGGGASARAYYERLERESARIVTFSPYAPGARPPPFNFDLSFNYLPGAYERPGPLVELHRLTDCASSPIVRPAASSSSTDPASRTLARSRMRASKRSSSSRPTTAWQPTPA